jgi:hypothetical protein
MNDEDYQEEYEEDYYDEPEYEDDGENEDEEADHYAVRPNKTRIKKEIAEVLRWPRKFARYPLRISPNSNCLRA